jgi:hypothetical protein
VKPRRTTGCSDQSPALIKFASDCC